MNNEAFDYGDRNLVQKNKYKPVLDKLSLTYNISPKINIQLGENIYEYINILYKTELDKNLRNSLNLLAINF